MASTPGHLACWRGRDGRSGTIETVNVTPEIRHRPGQPRSERDAAFLQRFDARMRLPIIVSAILPLIVAPESHDWVGAVVGITTWLVFLLDYVVYVRHLEHYGRTGFGRLTCSLIAWGILEQEPIGQDARAVRRVAVKAQ